MYRNDVVCLWLYYKIWRGVWVYQMNNIATNAVLDKILSIIISCIEINQQI
jgi:hypothetical protein